MKVRCFVGCRGGAQRVCAGSKFKAPQVLPALLQPGEQRTNERTNETKKGRNTPWFGVATQRSLVEHDHLPRQARDRQNETRPNQKKALVVFSSFLLFFFSSFLLSQDWVDVHPAKFGYHATGRPFDAEAAGGDVAPPTVRNELLMFDGWMTQKVYHAAFDHIARKFFTLDNYYTLPTKQADGTVRRQQRLFRLDFPQPISAVSCFM
jgi:hypothetical protein